MAKYSQPVISRETRLLLVTVIASVLALWLLARIRFQERLATADPVPPVLAQFRPQSNFDDLARSVADMRPAIAASMYQLDDGAAALRIREDAAVTVRSAGSAQLLGLDRATRLAAVRSPAADIPGLMPWVPRVLDYPRYLVAAEFTEGNLALRPVFVGGLFATASPLWAGEIWMLPRSTAIQPGTFVFTAEGAFAGLAFGHNGRTALVPATHVLKFGEQLLREGMYEPGRIGVSVQALTPAMATATGAAAGVIVTAVEPDSPAAGSVAVTDVIEAIEGQNITTVDHWRARIERLRAGQTLLVRIRRSGAVSDVRITAAATTPAAPVEAGVTQTPPSAEASLGLRLRSIARLGVEVLSVDPLSRAARASIQPGDVITVVGSHANPSSMQVMREYASLPEGGSVLVALTRGSEHLVVVLEK